MTATLHILDGVTAEVISEESVGFVGENLSAIFTFYMVTTLFLEPFDPLFSHLHSRTLLPLLLK